MTLTKEGKVGHKVLVEAEIVSNRKLADSGDGLQMDYFLVKVRGQSGAVAVVADSVRDFEPPNFQQTDVDFDETRTLISKNIRLRRQDANLSQFQLAQLLGVSQNAVSQWETGSCVPRFYMVPSLTKALGITIPELYGDFQNG